MDNRTTRQCIVCGDTITEDLMIPEGVGPMHTGCWQDWVQTDASEEAWSGQSDIGLEGPDHYESFYHCVECRQVFYLEETDRKLTERCPNCGLTVHFKITEADDGF